MVILLPNLNLLLQKLQRVKVDRMTWGEKGVKRGNKVVRFVEGFQAFRFIGVLAFARGVVAYNIMDYSCISNGSYLYSWHLSDTALY